MVVWLDWGGAIKIAADISGVSTAGSLDLPELGGGFAVTEVSLTRHRRYNLRRFVTLAGSETRPPTYRARVAHPCRH